MKNVKELESFVKYLRNAYGKSMVSGEILDFLSSQIKHVPSEALPWIKEQFPRRHKVCPDTLHVAILDLWRSWRAEHPEKCACEPGGQKDCVNMPDPKTGIGNCHGGWMVFWKREKLYGDRLTSFVVPCGDCRRSGNTSMRAWTMKAALEVNQDWEPDCDQIRKRHEEEIDGPRFEMFQSIQAESKRKIIEGYKGASQ